MIVYSAALLSDSNFAKPQIGYQTWARAMPATSVTVSTETASGPKDAPLRPDTAEYWQASAMPATWKINLGQARDINYVGVAGHQIGSKGATAKVELSLDDSAYTQLASDAVPTNDTPLMFIGSQTTGQYVRLTLTGSLVPRVASIYVGVTLQMMKMPAGGWRPVPLARKTTLQQTLSRGGQFLGQGFRSHGIESEIGFKNLSAAWIRSGAFTNFDAFSRAARGLPYFLAWNPLQYPSEIGYVWTEKDIVPKYSGQGDLMDVNWSVVGVGAA